MTEKPINGSPTTLQPNPVDARRLRMVPVASQYLLDVLGFPRDAILVDIRVDPQRVQQLQLLIAHATFEPVEPGDLVPAIAPAFKSVPGERPELVEWDEARPAVTS